MKAKRTAKYCAVLRFSFLLLLAGLHENGDSASWFIGRLIIVLRNGSFVLMNGLVFLPTSHFLPPLLFSEGYHFSFPTEYYKSTLALKLKLFF